MIILCFINKLFAVFVTMLYYDMLYVLEDYRSRWNETSIHSHALQIDERWSSIAAANSWINLKHPKKHDED